MAGFVRRFGAVPPVSVIEEIEGPVLVDLPPPGGVQGAGTGTVVVVGEFEDGPFAVDASQPDNSGILQVSGASGLASIYGGFGYFRDGMYGADPCARRHLGEDWNGNGHIKLFGVRFGALQVARVDTSVGSVTFDVLACLQSTRSLPVPIAVGSTLEFTTEQGGPAASTAIAATFAVATGVGGTYPTGFVGGESIRITTNNQTVDVVFSSADSALVDVIARINSAVGYTMASEAGGELVLTNGEVRGLSSVVAVSNLAGTPLTTLGIGETAYTGTGNVANSDAVTMAEVAALINGSAGLVGIGVSASLTPDGRLRVCSDGTGGTGRIEVSAGDMQDALGLPLGNTAPTDHPGGTIPAGTRLSSVLAPGTEWLTMQTVDVPAQAVGPFSVKVRPALDDGSAPALVFGGIDTVVDAPTWAALAVSNPTALSAALTEPQIDAAYDAAMRASLEEKYPSVQANYLLSARRSDAVVLSGRANAADADAAGIFGRKFVTGSKLGTSPNDAYVDVAQYRSDRVFYTALGLRVNVPAIAARGTAGGVGFTSDGNITVRPDGLLAGVCSVLAPEEDPGQALGGLADRFFDVDTFGNVVNIETYKLFKALGICAPRLDRQSGMVFQSGVTSSLVSGLQTQARRKMADFILDTLGVFANPYTKQLNTQARRDGFYGDVDQWLSGLKSEDAPDLQRIEDYRLDDSEAAGNTDATRAKGIYYLKVEVRTLSSLKNIVIVAEIGESVRISQAA